MSTTVSAREELDERVAALFASEPAALTDPFSLYADVREAARVYDHRGLVVLLTHYDDVKAVIRDGARLSNQALRSGSRADAIRAAKSGDELVALDEVNHFEANYMSRADGDIHDRLRGVAHRAFTPRRIAELRASIEQYTDELIAESAGGGTVDLMHVAYRLPLQVVCDMLGAPAEDRERIHAWSGKLGRNRGGIETGPLMEAHVAMQEFRDYVYEIIAEHRRHPQEGLTGALLDAEKEGRLSAEELAGMYVVLIFAGHETTTNLIGIGMLELLRRPDQWRMICEDPSLIPGAVEELLRFVAPVQWLHRYTLEDIEVAGVRIPKGMMVVPVLASANRDPAYFERPNELDIRRPDVRNHLGFGFGIHFCIGSSLARMEGEIALRRLAETYPDLDLVNEDQAWGGNAMLRTLHSLPVRVPTGAHE